jgi:hypothetical protein
MLESDRHHPNPRQRHPPPTTVRSQLVWFAVGLTTSDSPLTHGLLCTRCNASSPSQPNLHVIHFPASCNSLVHTEVATLVRYGGQHIRNQCRRHIYRIEDLQTNPACVSLHTPLPLLQQYYPKFCVGSFRDTEKCIDVMGD